MKIGINASFSRKQNTGIGQVTLNFLKELLEFSRQGEKIKSDTRFILYLEEDLPEEFVLPENFEKRTFLPYWKRDDLIRKIWWEKFLLPKKIREDKCEVFLSLYQNPTILRNKIKHVMIVHDIIPNFFPGYLNNWRKRFYWRMTEKAIRKADKIISISHRTEKDMVQYLEIDPKKISVSYIAADEIYKKEVSNNESEKVLEKYGLEKGYIYSGGGMEVRKNVEGTIRAYKELLDSESIFDKFELPDLVISGKLLPQLAPLVTDVKALVSSMGIESRVKLLDFVPQEDLPVLYKNAILFSYPSFYEGFGLPVLEAMHQGVPVLTSKKSSLPEVGADSVLYCDPADIKDIAMVMKNILANEHLRQTLSEKGKKRSQNFSCNKFTEKILNILYVQ